MHNMSYVRWENTEGALRECYNSMEDEPSSESELQARSSLFSTMIEMLDAAHDLGLLEQLLDKSELLRLQFLVPKDESCD